MLSRTIGDGAGAWTHTLWECCGEQPRLVGQFEHSPGAEIGLIHMQARYMDPVLGRFISEDPAGNGSNRFVYCGNNPVCAVGITGCFLIQAVAIILLVVIHRTTKLCAIGIRSLASRLSSCYTRPDIRSEAVERHIRPASCR